MNGSSGEYELHRCGSCPSRPHSGKYRSYHQNDAGGGKDGRDQQYRRTQPGLHLALGIPAVETDDPETAKRITNAIAFRRRLINAAGGALTAEKVRALLGHKTIQAVYKSVKDRRLLMVEDNGTKLFPVFQFNGNAILPGISKVLNAAPQTTGWAILQYLVGGDEGLDGMRPIELLKGSDAEVERVVRFARTLED